MIRKEKAQNIAEQEVKSALVSCDSPLAPWTNTVVGEPVLVHDLNLLPSYWLVPVTVVDRTIGFVRILGNGRVFAIGTFGDHPDQLKKCPKVVTGISADEARRLVADSVQITQEESVAEPVFVHDGPIGRETWLVIISRRKQPLRWVFVTRGGYYERPAGETLDDTTEL